MSSQPVVSTFEEGSIADTAARARQLFLCCREITTEKLQKLALAQLARFNLWASNIGVFASHHASLDYRLRTALSVRAAVEGNLEIVCKHLLKILKGSPELSEEEFEKLFDTPQSQVSVFANSLFPKSTSNNHIRIDAFKHVEAKITLLHQLSLAIRRASNRNNLTKIPKIFNIDKGYAIIREQKEDGINSQIIIESVRFDTGPGFEKFVRKALTHRWLRYRSSNEEALNKQQHNYRQTLLERCISAVSTRRRQLEYFRAHQNRLEQKGEKEFLFRPPDQKSIAQDTLQSTVHSKDKDPHAGLLNDPRLDQPSKISYEPSNYTHDETVTSEFIAAKFKLPPASSAPSSSASTSAGGGFGGDSPFDVPQPPELDLGEKEKSCPYCYLILPARTFSTQKRARRWERHLLEDLQPYVCLFTNCTTPGKTYSSFGAWKSHLSQPHYDSWQCSLHPKDDSSNDTNDESFNTLAEFQSHLKIFHSDCDPMSANDPSQHVHQLTALPQWCFVCFETFREPATLLQHMTTHFKSMSLLALPWRDDIADDEATASGKVVISDAIDAQVDALDTELAGINFWDGEKSAETATEPTQALDVQKFASLLSAVNEASMTDQGYVQNLETWTEELEIASEILEPAQEPDIPSTPEMQAIRTDPSENKESKHKDEGERSTQSAKSFIQEDETILNPFGSVFQPALTTVQNVSAQYTRDIQGLQDLPNEFEEVNRYFPLAEGALRRASLARTWDELAMQDINFLATSIGKGADILHNIFINIDKKIKQNSDHKSVSDCYHDTLMEMGESCYVEAVMLGILKDLDVLFTYKKLDSYKDTIASELRVAIKRLSKEQSSVPVADSNAIETSFSHDAHGDQNVTTGPYEGSKGSTNSEIRNFLTRFRFKKKRRAPDLERNQQGQELHEGKNTNKPLDGNDGSYEGIKRYKVPLLTENTPIHELWRVAYEKLQEEDGELIKNYETELTKSVAASLVQIVPVKANNRDEIEAILRIKMDEINKNMSSSAFKARAGDFMQLFVKVVDSANDYISDAASANSYTSIAWTGVSLVLPLLLNPSEERDALAKGLDYITSLITQSRMREELYVECYESGSDSRERFRQSHNQYKTALEKLYRQILRFQATVYCYYANTTALRFAEDSVKWNSWEQLVNELLDQENYFASIEEKWRDMQRYEEHLAVERLHQATINSLSAQLSVSQKALENATRNEYADLLRWLCDIDHSSLYTTARDRHETGTNEWLVKDSKEFKAWETEQKSLLWLHGKAGSGKSILTSSAIKYLRDQYPLDSSLSTALAYFYFSFSDSQKQKVDGMLASLIKQICLQLSEEFLFIEAFRDHKKRGQRPDTRTLEKMLISSTSSFSNVYVVIDALDECPLLNDQRDNLLKTLERILLKAPRNLHIFLTSRNEKDIDDKLRVLLSPPSRIEIDLLAHQERLNCDINHYINLKLSTEDFDSWPESIKKEVKQSLMEKSDCMFLYVRLQFEVLRKLSSIPKIRKALQDVPDGLHATYDRII